MSVLVRAQPGLSASVTVTLVRVTSPVLVTTMVKVAVSPVVAVWVGGDLVIEIAGWVTTTGGAGGVVTVTGALSLAVTSGPTGGWPVTLAMLVKEARRATVVQVELVEARWRRVPVALSQRG